MLSFKNLKIQKILKMYFQLFSKKLLFFEIISEETYHLVYVWMVDFRFQVPIEI